MHPNGTPPRLYGTLARMWVVALLIVAPAQASTTLAGAQAKLITCRIQTHGIPGQASR